MSLVHDMSLVHVLVNNTEDVFLCLSFLCKSVWQYFILENYIKENVNFRSSTLERRYSLTYIDTESFWIWTQKSNFFIKMVTFLFRCSCFLENYKNMFSFFKIVFTKRIIYQDDVTPFIAFIFVIKLDKLVITKGLPSPYIGMIVLIIMFKYITFVVQTRPRPKPRQKAKRHLTKLRQEAKRPLVPIPHQKE